LRGQREGETFGSGERREKEKGNVKKRRPGPHLMVHAIPFHPRNAVAIPKTRPSYLQGDQDWQKDFKEDGMQRIIES